MVEKIPTEIINMILFTNQKEVDRAIQAAVDQYERYKRSLRKMGKRKKRRKQKTVVQSG
jgi:predicted nucleotide-binding protein (sugar kinase/HSP70/actin superfamily)